MKIIIMTIGLILLGGWNGYCEGEAKPAEKTEAASVKPTSMKEDEKPKVVIKVNGTEIDELDLLGMTNTLMPGAMVHGSISEEKKMEVKKNAFNKLILNELMVQMAKKQNIEVNKREIEKRIAELKKQFKKNKTTLDKTLKNAKITINELKKEIEDTLSINMLNEKIDKELKTLAAETITDIYIEDYYNMNKENFKVPERLRLREILLRVDASGGPIAWDEKRLRTEEILKKIEEGNDFAKIANEVSEDMYASKGGDMGFSHIGSIVPEEIETVAKELNVGDVAGPIMSLFGYHIIKLEEKGTSVQKTFEEVKENLEKDLEITEFKKLKKEWLWKLKKDAKIEYLNEEDRIMMGVKEKKEDENKDKN